MALINRDFQRFFRKKVRPVVVATAAKEIENKTGIAVVVPVEVQNPKEVTTMQLTGYKSQITAVVGILFVVASRFVPADLLTPENKDAVTGILAGLYALFLAAKAQRSLKK